MIPTQEVPSNVNSFFLNAVAGINTFEYEYSDETILHEE